MRLYSRIPRERLKSNLPSDLAETIVTSFIQNSWNCVEVIVKELTRFKSAQKIRSRSFQFRDTHGNESTLDNGHFFLRASVEYSTPHLTLEELQGIIAARLLEVCGNHFYNYGLHQANKQDVDGICEMLKKPPQGTLRAFLLNTDDVEPDRYSANPLRESIVSSGQSAFPSASVKTNDLKIDQNFTHKYEGKLISKGEIELIKSHLGTSNTSYVDMVDTVKYEQLKAMSDIFGIDLSISLIRLPIAALEKEESNGLLHHIIREVHTDFDSIERAYNCMGRSIQKRTTLLTIPHSEKGYGSKRAATGKIYFDGKRLKEVHVRYQTTLLYKNEVDPADISIAKADDQFTVNGEKLVNYKFRDTPSSPQFFLYSLGSPENASIWHGIGVFAPPQLLKSYKAIRLGCARDSLIRDLEGEYGITAGVPLSFNLVPKKMWNHPVHRNIDASIGCVENMRDLANMGMHLEYLSTP